MTVWQLTLHLFHFVMPALAMALAMPWLGRWVIGRGQGRVWRRTLVHALVGILVLTAGLVLQGDDGKMSTYAALVLVAATTEWWMQRGWAPR